MDAPSNNDPAYGYTAHLAEVLFADARARITEALKSEGFGIFTEIDVTATPRRSSIGTGSREKMPAVLFNPASLIAIAV